MAGPRSRLLLGFLALFLAVSSFIMGQKVSVSLSQAAVVSRTSWPVVGAGREHVQIRCGAGDTDGSCLTSSELDRGLGSCAHLLRLRSVSRHLGWQGCVSLPSSVSG